MSFSHLADPLIRELREELGRAYDCPLGTGHDGYTARERVQQGRQSHTARAPRLDELDEEDRMPETLAWSAHPRRRYASKI